MNRVAEEIRLSYTILFTRNDGSRQIARKLFKSESVNVEFISEELVRKFSSGRTFGHSLTARRIDTIRIMARDSGSPVSFDRFLLLRARLMLLQDQMLERKPQTVRELLMPSYSDRLAFYNGWYNVMVVSLTMWGLVCSLIIVLW